MKQLICKECGGERENGRRLCNSCNSKRIAAYPRYTWTKTCEACNAEFSAIRKLQKICKLCHESKLKLAAKLKSSNQYAMTNKPGRTVHRDVAEEILGRKLHTNEVVHHIDCDPKNNSAHNLLVISRKMHGRLHAFLDLQRVILEKSSNENFENCWNTLIAPMTTAWLETTCAKVEKLWEIGRSAAEPLTMKIYEEGSETMHEDSETGDAVEYDIVQTTTG